MAVTVVPPRLSTSYTGSSPGMRQSQILSEANNHHLNLD